VKEVVIGEVNADVIMLSASLNNTAAEGWGLTWTTDPPNAILTPIQAKILAALDPESPEEQTLRIVIHPASLQLTSLVLNVREYHAPFHVLDVGVGVRNAYDMHTPHVLFVKFASPCSLQGML